MKKFLPIFCLLVIAARGYSQQFSQYNTGTLYDSFENPSQRSFVPDTSKQYAFNFFVPNFNANFFVKGDAQASLVSRAFSGKYNNADLQIGNGSLNNFNNNLSAYFLMFKWFTSLKGDSEMGFFLQTKSDGRGVFTDETVALFNGPADFPENTYDNIFNNHHTLQVYNAIGLSYRENITKRLAFGVKFSVLMGVYYNKLDIDESHINFDKAADEAAISLRGTFYQSKGPGNVDARSFYPTFRSPGAAISFGTSYRTEDAITIQANIKDLGFIHWYSYSYKSQFNDTQTAHDISGPKREDSIYKTANLILNSAKKLGSYTSATDGRFELSATKSYWLDLDRKFKYSPTIIGSKELLYNGFTAALVNHFQYQNYHVSLTASYDNYNLFNFGTQFMIKSYNGEFFIGSDRLFQTAKLVGAMGNGSSYTNGPFTGTDIYLGFSLKFGPVIEHPLNASVIPNGEKGFLGRLWSRLFKTYE